MSDHSKIEWTERTWNVISGCTRVSEGCDHCYITSTPPFRISGRRFDGDGPGSTTGLVFHPDRLDQPLRVRKPQRWFVNSLADLFHDQVSDEYIAKVFAVMAATPRHTYQVLTKRHGRMRALLSSDLFRRRMYDALVALDYQWINEHRLSWPLPNVWLGVSVETQQWADIRVPALLDTPAAVRFLSCEPLLRPVSLFTRYDDFPIHGGLVDWVIVGGESGPHARPMHADWARALRDQCRRAGVPYFFKQWGEHAPRCTLALCGTPCSCNGLSGGHPIQMRRVGKKAAGRELDGRTWDQYPQAVTT